MTACVATRTVDVAAGGAVTTPTTSSTTTPKWGVPVHDDRAVFEKLCLEAFQAGLSWLTVLRKRAALRRAFAGFDPVAIAGFGPAEVAALLTDEGIIRNRAKIEATIDNARAFLHLTAAGESLAALLWSHRPASTSPPPRTPADVPATTPESTALARALRARGWRFVGPTTCYATMQALGVVDDHLVGCWCRGD